MIANGHILANDRRVIDAIGFSPSFRNVAMLAAADDREHLIPASSGGGSGSPFELPSNANVEVPCRGKGVSPRSQF
jgi:hypothetical protein